MSPALELLPAVRWRGVPIAGVRPAVLLATLALSPSGVSDPTLVQEVWGDDVPANPTKALQVLVSRLRAASGPDVVARTARGYRLGLATADVDAWLLDELAREADLALASGRPDAAELASRALALCESAAPADGEDDARSRLLREAARRRPGLLRVRGLALLARGDHATAYAVLGTALQAAPQDGTVLAGLLRAEAVAAGTAVALERYEAHRADLADRLGVGPDPALQRVHRELLAADDPRRSGVHFDPDELVGREQDLARVRAALASGRLTTVIGPGGIGKTRVAHVLAREATQPRVHVIELVGVGSDDDVVAEVGAALGVRGSMTARHALTPAQQADVRSRIVAELSAGPTLLVLDNCEHVRETVATLVAFLLVSTSDLVVLATSRAPLRIGAERVVPLSQLRGVDAEGLFVRRALAVRPDADADPDVVRDIADRLDGLPLAIELAAARVRTLSVREVAQRLEDRFGLLRGRDRGVPERHRTLTAVIEWSWDLLTEPEQRALARLSVFHDGFDSRTASAVLGHDADDLVEALCDQSLLVVGERDGRVRFRALETIREFAAARLAASGEEQAALDAQDGWALGLAHEHREMLNAADQVDRVDRLLGEESNLTDVLRRALADGDRRRTAHLVALLGNLWTITGDQPRIFAIADAATDLLGGWDVPPELRATAQEAAGVLIVHLSWMPNADLGGLRHLLTQGGRPAGVWALIAHTVFVADDPPTPEARLVRLASTETRPAAAAGLLMWAAITAENAGDAAAATRHAEAALEHAPLPPYLLASVHAELAQLALVAGDHHTAVAHAEQAWPLLVRLHSDSDARNMQVATALAPLFDGDAETAERILHRLGPPDAEAAQLGARMVWLTAHAEVALARGDVAEALRRFDGAVEAMSGTEIPGVGVTPWLMLAGAAALVARARRGPDDPDPRAEELRDLVLDSFQLTPDGALWFTDLPLNGVLLVALAAWGLRFGPPEHHEDMCRLLAVAHRWAYNRSIPVMAWEPMRALADSVRAGRVDVLVQEYADLPGPSLLPDVAACVERLRRAWVTSSG